MSELLFLRSGRIFAGTGFMDGASRVLDLMGTMDAYNENSTPAEADREALYSDWASVGDHLILAAQEVV